MNRPLWKTPKKTSVPARAQVVHRRAVDFHWREVCLDPLRDLVAAGHCVIARRTPSRPSIGGGDEVADLAPSDVILE